ncbi:MAG: hypothetical protein ACFB13_12090 [Kiloniellaceae bacterium]
MSEKKPLVRTEPELVRARYPSGVPNGALVIAPYDDEFFPAIKWFAKEGGEDYHGLAFLAPIGEHKHPVSIVSDEGEYVAVIQSLWRFNIQVDSKAISQPSSHERIQCGLALGDNKMYLRLPLAVPGRALLQPQFIDLSSGVAPHPGPSERGLIFFAEWELLLGNSEDPVACWPLK